MALVAGQIPVSGYRVPDYSGAAAAGGAAAAAPYQMISDLAGQVGDYFKQQGEKKKLVKQSSLQIDAALQLFPDLAPSFQGLKERMKDENIPLADRAAEAEVVANLINTGIGEMRNRADMSFKQQQFEAEQQYRQAGLGMQAAELGVRQQARQQEAQTEAAKRTEGEISIFDPTIGKERKAKVWKDQFGNAFDWDTKKPIIDTEKYFYGEEGGLGDLPPTSQVGGISDSIAKVAQMNIGRLSTAKTPGTQGGGLGCADAVCKIYNQATGEELVQGGTLSTSKMIESLSGDPRFQSIPINQARAGDIIVTPRGKEAGHTGIFVSDNEIASNSSKGFRGGQRGTLERNYSKGSWMSSVATRNPGTTQVFRRIEEAASPQMAGTPEQQAEVARQIEQGAGMATAQTGGAMPTEPSMAQQQPQIPERRMVRGVPVGGGTAQFRPSTPEEEQMYGSKGQVNTSTGEFKPIRPPSGMVIRQTPEGGLEFVQGPGAADRFAKAAEESKKQQIQSADINVQDLMEIKRMYADINQKEGVGPAVKRSAESFVIGTPMYALKVEMIEPFKKRLGLEQLTKMRQASPTGGALGQVSNEEGTRLESIFGSLDPAASPRIFNRNVDRAIESYLDVIHGSIEERQKMVEEGKITAEQNAQIESLYPGSTMDTRGVSQPRQTGGTGDPTIDEIIQRNNIQIK